jgi:hypothetical protein
MKMNDGIAVRGFYRLHITEDGEVVGDSGWKENLVTNDGFLNYLVKSLGSVSGSSYIGFMALGTGGVPATDDTTLAGEVVKRTAVTAATSATSKTLRFTATFSSAGSFVTNNQNISNVGLFASSTGGTLFSGNTYASSTVATNQNVNATYDIVFS